MGAEDYISDEGDTKEANEYNIIRIVLKTLINSTKTIDVINLMEEYQLKYQLGEQFVQQTKNLISNIEREPFTYINKVMHDKIFCYYNKDPRDIIILDTFYNIEKMCQKINIETLQQYLFFEYPINGTKFSFPMQFTLEKRINNNKTIKKLLILKGLSVNLMSNSTTGYHFVTYIRKKFDKQFLLIDDHRIIETNIKDVHQKRPRIALYFVIDID